MQREILNIKRVIAIYLKFFLLARTISKSAFWENEEKMIDTPFNPRALIELRWILRPQGVYIWANHVQKLPGEPNCAEKTTQHVGDKQTLNLIKFELI